MLKILLAGLAVGLAGVAEAAAADGEPVSRALLIAVERYDPAWGWTPLTGPKGDAIALRGALLERGGFRAEHVVTLFDEQATRAGILAALDELARSAGRDDLLLVFFAGHGSQVPDDDGEEADAWDETLVPFDAVGPAGAPNDIRDDDLSAFIERANEVTDNLVFLFDCCASGTNVRSGSSRVSRFIAPEQRGFAGRRSTAGTRAAPLPASDYFPESKSYVALSACRASQSALEMEVQTEQGATTHGVFTWSLVQELYDLGPETSYGDLLERVRRRVAAEAPGQTPVIEGPLERRLLFGGRSVAQEPYLELRHVQDDRWELRGGSLIGLSAGAKLGVCDDRAPADRPEHRLGRVAVERLGPLRSSVRWLEGPPAGATGPFRAFLGREALRAGVLRLRLRTDDAAAREALTAALADIDRVIALVDEHAELEAVLGADGRWTLTTAAGETLPVAAGADDEVALGDLVRAIERLGRAHVLAHGLAAAQGDLTARWELLRVVDGKETDLLWSSETGSANGAPLDLLDGEQVALRITNESPTRVWATLLVIAPDGEVSQVWQTAEDEPIPPGGASGTPRLAMTVTRGAEAFYRDGKQRFIGLVTPRPIDLGAFEQAPVVSATRMRGAALPRPQPLDASPDLLGEAFGLTALDVRLSAGP